MNLILRLLNWQLLAGMTLIPLMITLSIFQVFNIESHDSNALFRVVSIVYFFTYVAWNHRIIKVFNKENEILTEKQLKRLGWLLVVLSVMGVFMIFSRELSVFAWSLPSPVSIAASMVMFIAMFLSFYAYIFMIYCTAKTLKWMQLKENLRTADIVIEMIAIYFFPIGVWWLQNKVNRLYRENID
ncbi:MAG: hypothetical protein JXR76_03180 [Deltaproteobacteria bacterium]|nr:hypothetical protein [Deltaproteobacteria bacterium]